MHNEHCCADLEDEDAKRRHAGEQCDDEPQHVPMTLVAWYLRTWTGFTTVDTILRTEPAQQIATCSSCSQSISSVTMQLSV